MFPAMGAVGLFVLSSRIWLLNYRQMIASRLNQAIGVLIILFMISCNFAEFPSEAWLGLANFVPFFWLFMALQEVIHKPANLKQLSWMLILPSLPIVALGLAQLYLNLGTPSVVKSILGWELVPQGVPAGRMSSVFIYTNFLAIYLAIAFTLALGLWLDTWYAVRRKFNLKQNQILLILTVILLADVVGLILTSSRNAWGIAVISFMAYAAFLGWRWLILGVTGAATAIFWASFAPDLGGIYLRKFVPAFIWTRLSDQLYDRPIETLRITQWKFCWDLIKERPISGWGLRNFSPLYEAKTNYWFGHPHNLYLMLGAETGIISTLLLILIFGLVMYQGTFWLINSSPDSPKLIYFSYLVVFACCTLFNLLDVTIFDLRVNTIIWIILAAIGGIAVNNKQPTQFGDH